LSLSGSIVRLLAALTLLASCGAEEGGSGAAPHEQNDVHAEPAEAARATAQARGASNNSGVEGGGTMGSDAMNQAPRGFQTGQNFTALPDNPQVRFDLATQDLRDDGLPGTYKRTANVRDNRAYFTLRTDSNEVVSIIFVHFDDTDSIPAKVRVYSVKDQPGISPAGEAVRERLTLARFASALTALPSLSELSRPYTIYFKPLAQGEIL
jgi:hypothetical protein